MHIFNNFNCKVKSNHFSTVVGCTEYYITLTSADNSSMDECLDDFKNAYDLTLMELGLNENTLQFSRVYVSDIANDYPVFLSSDLYKNINTGAVSVIEQSPLSGPVSVIIYHVKNDKEGLYFKKCKSPQNSVYTTGKNYSLLWTADLTNNAFGCEEQTDGIFDALSASLAKHNMAIANNTVRTWIYVRDIDNNYKGMVDSRRELFSKIGLTEKTRYIASTGIEGKSVESSRLVSMDAFSIGNLKEEQIVKMEAPENLSSTAIYNVTFERGTRIRFGDRSHLYISGTASIDNKGEILYRGDIRGQTERTLDNIDALLKPHNATLAKMQYIILYLRNRKHFQFIQDIIVSRIPDNVLLLPVEGCVCRPGWLIEMEGVAIIEDSTDFPPFF